MVKIPLKVESKKSVFDGKTLIESVNINILNKLIMSRDEDGLLKSYDKITHNDIYQNEFVKKTYCTERQQLIEYAKNIKLGKIFVRYDKTKNLNNYGRVIPFRSLGLFSFRKQIRGALAFGLYVDIDISNCHPTLLLQIAQHNNIECKYLSKYVNNREKYINLVMDTYKCSKDDAKTLFIILLYFGSFNKWAENLNIKDDEIKFIHKLKKELKEIGKILVDNNKNLINLLQNKRLNDKSNKKNIVGGIVSYILQEWECQIIETLYNYCSDNQIINHDCVLCADGIMIKANKYNDELLIKFNELIKEKLGFDLTFIKKELNTEIYDKLK